MGLQRGGGGLLGAVARLVRRETDPELKLGVMLNTIQSSLLPPSSLPTHHAYIQTHPPPPSGLRSGPTYVALALWHNGPPCKWSGVEWTADSSGTGWPLSADGPTDVQSSSTTWQDDDTDDDNDISSAAVLMMTTNVQKTHASELIQLFSWTNNIVSQPVHCYVNRLAVYVMWLRSYRNHGSTNHEYLDSTHKVVV